MLLAANAVRAQLFLLTELLRGVWRQNSFKTRKSLPQLQKYFDKLLPQCRYMAAVRWRTTRQQVSRCRTHTHAGGDC